MENPKDKGLDEHDIKEIKENFVMKPAPLPDVDFTCKARHGDMTEALGFKFCPICGESVYKESKDEIDTQTLINNVGVILLTAKPLGASRKKIKMKTQNWQYARLLVTKLSWWMQIKHKDNIDTGRIEEPS